VTDRPASSADLPAFARGSRCASCLHVALVRTARGATFLRCARAAGDARYPKYPAQPVLRCDGHAEAAR
jgi:hypothetical protein